MSEASQRPNVIWVFGDQHRAQAQGHMGDPNVSTPTIDRLATEGVTFTRAVSGNPWCTPFRASLLTGRYPHQTCWQTPQRLDPSIPTIAHALGDAGYDTAWFGKWHLDGHPESQSRSALHVVPRERRGGFGTWIGYENNNSQYDCWVHGHEDSGKEIDLYRLESYETDALTDLLIEYVGARARGSGRGFTPVQPARPFFAALSVQPPHGPYVAPRDFMDRRTPAHIELRPNVPDVPDVVERARRELAGYYAQIENLDWNIERLRNALDQAKLADDTHIIFFSDHGDMHGSHGYFGKSMPWEESIRIPFVVSGRQPYYERPGGLRVAAPINHVDIAPTTLGLCGLDVPAEMQGFDYSGCCRKGATGSLEGLPDSAYLQHTVRKTHHHMIDRTWRGVVTADGWKYVCIPHQPLGMYDLNEDPYELRNMAYDLAFKDRRRQLHDRLARWIQETGDEFELPEI